MVIILTPFLDKHLRPRLGEGKKEGYSSRTVPSRSLDSGSWIRTNDLRDEAWVEYGLAAVDNGPELVYDVRTK